MSVKAVLIFRGHLSKQKKEKQRRVTLILIPKWVLMFWIEDMFRCCQNMSHFVRGWMSRRGALWCDARVPASIVMVQKWRRVWARRGCLRTKTTSLTDDWRARWESATKDPLRGNVLHNSDADAWEQCRTFPAARGPVIWLRVRIKGAVLRGIAWGRTREQTMLQKEREKSC